MTFTTSLFAAARHADEILVFQPRGVGHIALLLAEAFSDKPEGPVLLDCDTEQEQFEFAPQQIEIDDEGEAVATDIDGTQHRLRFSMHRPMRIEDLS